jgi:acetyl-CoA C-acetyltransferase
MKEVVIVSAVRTPMGSFGGSLSGFSATQLGGFAIKGAIEKVNLDPSLINEVFFGNVLQANLGQAPARQCSIYAGIKNDVPATTVNKVCASGMKAIMLGVQSIKCGDNDIVVVGGTESMSNVPHYVEKVRTGQRLGDLKLKDGLINDGLTDVYNQTHMGLCAEICAEDMNISRQEQDEFAIESYRRSKEAWEKKLFEDEIVPVNIPQRKGDPIHFEEDEEFKNVKIDKIRNLKSVFKKEGTITAANASTINDGASALILMSADKAKSLNIEPLAKIVSYADASHEPEWFTTAPAKALPVALNKANLDINDIDYFELNEAFSVVGIANKRLLNIDSDRVNCFGGAVSLGHPLGSSGSRIVVTLINVLNKKEAKLGAAAICNGGGGASALIIEKK